MEKSITVTQQFRAFITPKTRTGKDAPVQDATWASSDESVVSVVPEANGLGALVVAQGQGQATVNVLADADMGEGVKTISDNVVVTVGPGEAVSIGMQTGEVEEQPELVPAKK